MKKEIDKSVELGEGINAIVEGSKITLKGNGKEISRNFAVNNLSIKVEGNQIKISAKNATRRELKMAGTIEAHLKNMIKGLNEDFVYKLEICNVHFPMSVKVEGEKIIIKSFLGETTQREAQIMPNSKVEISGNQITVSSFDIESAGQTAANIEKAAKVKGRDRRIFQDGIFITNKCGREI